MKFSFLPLAVLAYLPLALAMGPSYFHITQPTKGQQWQQGTANVVKWVHSQDQIDLADVQLARMGSDGLLFGARAVPTKWGSLNIFLSGVPAGTDYYLVLLDSVHGVVYSISDSFTILAPGSTATQAPAVDGAKPTVTVSGGPNPTNVFPMTYGADAAGAVPILGLATGGQTTLILGLSCSILGVLAGGAWAVL